MSNLLFSAPWCGNCKGVKTKVDEIGFEHQYINIDLEDNTALVAEHVIRSLPTLITEAGDRLVGAAKILDFLKDKAK
ncbi:hypothetical protein [Pseudomonas phage Astolliot]|nr:hypothetical protein [Pseudomonas phage Astolliot]